MPADHPGKATPLLECGRVASAYKGKTSLPTANRIGGTNRISWIYSGSQLWIFRGWISFESISATGEDRSISNTRGIDRFNRINQVNQVNRINQVRDINRINHAGLLVTGDRQTKARPRKSERDIIPDHTACRSYRLSVRDWPWLTLWPVSMFVTGQHYKPPAARS